MKKIFYLAIIFILTCTGSVLADTTTYNLKDVGISVDIPSEYSVFTRETTDDDPNLQKLGLTKDTVLSYLESSNMYLCAMPDNKEFEIYISVVLTDDTIQSLNELSPEDLEKMYGRIRDNLSKTGLSVSNHSFYENGDKTFIKYFIQQSGADYMIHHCTIHNSKTISAMLRTTSGSFTDSQKNIIDTVAKSIIVPETSVQTDSTSENVYEPLTAVDYIYQLLPITIILIVAAIVIYHNKKKKQKN